MLIGNGARQFAHARTKQSGGGVWGAQLLGWNNPGRRNNRVLAWGGEWAGGKSSVPAGRTHPSAWLMPISSGSMAGRVGGVLTLDGAGVAGSAAQGSISGTVTLSGVGGLVSSAVGAISASFTLTGSVTAPANAIGAISGTLSMTGALGAMAGVTGAITGTLTLTATPSAIGHMDGEIGTTAAEELSPTAVAEAVWEALKADGWGDGSMGEHMQRLLTTSKYLGLK